MSTDSEEGRPVHRAASAGSASILSSTIRRVTDDGVMPRPLLPFVARGVQPDSDARLAGELAAARVAALEPLTYSSKCWQCAGASIDWLRWAAEEYGCCPHVLDEAS